MKIKQAQKIKIKYECIYDLSNPEEKLKADKKLEEVFDFIFRKAMEITKKDRYKKKDSAKKQKLVV